MPSRETLLNSCYILEWETRDYLAFQLMPEELTRQKSVNWQDTDIIGRSVPLKSYSGSAAAVVSLQLQFVGDTGSEAGGVKVESIARWVESLAYPRYRGGVIAPPSAIWLHLGEMIQMKCVVVGVTVAWKPPWQFDSQTGLVLEISIDFQEIGDIPPGLDDIRSGSLKSLPLPSQSKPLGTPLNPIGGKPTTPPASPTAPVAGPIE